MHPRRKISSSQFGTPGSSSNGGGTSQTPSPPPRPSSITTPRGSYLLLAYATLFMIVMSGVAWWMTDSNRGSVIDFMDAVSQVPVPLVELKLQTDEEEEQEEVITPSQSSESPPQQQQQQQQPPALSQHANTNNRPRRLVCVFNSNPRTASMFKTRVMERYGGGVFDYAVETMQRGCRQSYPDAPVVGMLYQKNVVAYGPKTLDSLIGSLDAFIIMGDEMCNTPVSVNAKAHARQYYSQTYVDYLTQNPSENSFATVYLPLGPRFEFQPVLPQDVPTPQSRKLLFNLIVSPTSIGRKRLADQLTAGLNKGIYEAEKVFVHITPAFKTNVSASEGFIPPEQYRAVLLNSLFTLCPAGKNPEAYRIFEAIESGSIPVLALDDEYVQHPCKSAFAPFIETNAPFIFIKSWADLDTELAKAMPTIEARQRDVIAWYEKIWTDVSTSLECLINERYKVRHPTDNSEWLESSCREQDVVQARTKGIKVVPAATSPKSSSPQITYTPLITGCGRTGTLSLADYLNEKGIPAVHERMEKGAISVSWLYAYPDSDLYPFESSKDLKWRKSLRPRTTALAVKGNSPPLFSPIIHIVRHPLKVISSTRRCFCGRGTRSTNRGERSDKKSWIFVEKQLGPTIMPPALPLDSLKRSMLYWYHWNMQILQTTRKQNGGKDIFFRIEDLNPRELVKSLGFGSQVIETFPERIPRDSASLRHVSPQSEKDKLPDVTWKDMDEVDKDLADKIRQLAKLFGYDAGNLRGERDDR